MNNKQNAQYWISHLKLCAHPEGGHFKEVYRSKEFINNNHLPNRYNSKRNYSTSIYFLLKDIDISRFHRLKSDEIWHFYQGNPITIYILGKNRVKKIKIGSHPEKKEFLQYTIPKGSWFGADSTGKKYDFSLLGCTVAPGFDFADFELGKTKSLLKQFPEHKKIITRLT